MVNSLRNRLSGPNAKVIFALYLAALILRLAFLWQIADLPTFDSPLMDEGYHLELAREILDGQTLPDQPFYRAPLYPYFFAGLLYLTGENLFAVRVIQSALGALVPVLTFLLGMRLFERRVALFGGIGATFYTTFLYYDNSLLITGLMTLLAALVLLRAAQTEERPTAGNFAALGALIGLAALARPNMLFFLPALALWVWLVIRPRLGGSVKNAVICWALTALCAATVIAPVTFHNWRVSGDFIPIAWQGGYNFYLGNNRQATGWSATAPGVRGSWQGGYEDAINIAEANVGRALTVKEVDDFWWEQGFAEISADPAAFIALLGKKKLYFFNGFEIPNNQNIYLVERFSGLAEALFWRAPVYFPFGLLAPLALLGIALSLKYWRRYLLLYLFVVSYFASVIMFFVCARYRQPVIPALLLFAGLAVFQVVGWLKSRKYTAALLSLAALLTLGALCNRDLIALDRDFEEANNEFLLGSAYQQQGDLLSADRSYRAALERAPNFVDAGVNLGIIAAQRGDLPEAERRLTAALRIDSANAQALMNLGMVYLQSERLADAEAALTRALAVEGLDYNVHYRLGLVYHLQGRYELALERYRAALRLKGDFAPARENLQIIVDELQKEKERR
ncbi:MAG TPA: tetratricopeptide repeat protein [candidate division Zixibacteria bacterium]|nr:tetratricopeptide repeat protein [candidate division Zixibacteria bacterium]